MTIIINSPEALHAFADEIFRQAGNLNAVLAKHAQESCRQQHHPEAETPAAGAPFQGEKP